MSKHDKSKSGGGLFDQWFGRPKTKGKSYASNGGRPVSAESDTLPEMQDLNNEIIRLSIEEVDQKFMEILEDMNIPKDKREPLLQKTLDEKRDMLFMHLKGTNRGTFASIYVTHAQFLGEFSQKEGKQTTTKKRQ